MKINSKKILPIVLCTILALVLILGIVLGTVAIVAEARAVVSYEGVRIERGVASCLAATYKAMRTAESDEATERAVERYIRRLAVAASLFDRISSLDAEDKEWIENNCAEVLDFHAERDPDKFDSLAEPMGFDYSDFLDATELIYKASAAITEIYGVGGAKLSYSENAYLVREYFETYTHVKILFVRTEDKLVHDTEGNLVPDGEGGYKTIALTDEERAAVLLDVGEITTLINNANSGTGAEMSLETFNSYYEKYNEEPAHAEGGYYLHESSAFTAYLAENMGYPTLVDTALSMDVGEWGKSVDGGIVCFIYKYAPIVTDYASSEMARFFSDFYSDAAEYLFSRSVDELTDDVRVKDAYSEINVAALPKNKLFKTPLGTGVYWE